MVYLGGRCGLCQSVPRENTGCHPPTGKKLLLKQEISVQVSAGTQSTTHQHVPFVNIIDGINTNIKIPQQAEDLNPIQQLSGPTVQPPILSTATDVRTPPHRLLTWHGSRSREPRAYFRAKWLGESPAG